MEIIEGFTAAKSRLFRQPSLGFGEASEGVKRRLKELFGREISLEEAVDQIVSDIKARGESALEEYNLKIDGASPSSLVVSKDQIKAAYEKVSPELIGALRLAAERIWQFHQEQKDAVWHGIDGEEYGQMVRPLSRVGLYAPGGTAPLISSVLMIAIPPKVAGVKEIILATPPRENGSIPPAMLVAADIAGVDRVFGMGGAQAIAAMAFGTKSVPKVDKICGPGNQFVMLAKKAVFGAVDIDALQGPSEVLIIADDSASAEYCAADLLAQAEHGQLPQVILVTTSRRLAADVQAEIEKQLGELSRKEITAESLERQGIIVIVENIDQAVELANSYAPEHLELAVEDAESYLDRIENAGCVFVGHNSAEAIGDYIAGPNHSLPTSGTARFSSPLNILDFMKIIDIVRTDRASLEKLGPAAMIIARAEGLEAHARAIERRLK